MNIFVVLAKMHFPADKT